MAEVNNAVAVGDRVRFVKQLDQLAVVKLSPTFFKVCVGGNHIGGRLGRLQPNGNVVLCDHGGVMSRIVE